MSPQRHTVRVGKGYDLKMSAQPSSTTSPLMLTAAGRAKSIYKQIALLDNFCSSVEKGRNGIIALRRAVLDVRQLREQDVAVTRAASSWIGRFGALKIVHQAMLHISTCSEEIFQVIGNKLEHEHLPACDDVLAAQTLLVELLAFMLVSNGTRAAWLEYKLDWLTTLESICSTQLQGPDGLRTYCRLIDVIISCLTAGNNQQAVRFASVIIARPNSRIMTFLENTMCGGRGGDREESECKQNGWTTLGEKATLNKTKKEVVGPDGSEFNAALALTLMSWYANEEFESNRYGCRRAASEIVANLLQRHLFEYWARFVLDKYIPESGLGSSPHGIRPGHSAYPEQYWRLAIVFAYVFYEQCGGRQQQISRELTSSSESNFTPQHDGGGGGGAGSGGFAFGFRLWNGLVGGNNDDNRNIPNSRWNNGLSAVSEGDGLSRSVHRRFAQWLRELVPPVESYFTKDASENVEGCQATDERVSTTDADEQQVIQPPQPLHTPQQQHQHQEHQEQQEQTQEGPFGLMATSRPAREAFARALTHPGSTHSSELAELHLDARRLTQSLR